MRSITRTGRGPTETAPTWGAAALGGTGALLAALATALVGQAALAGWPGGEPVTPESAVLAVLLPVAALLLGWVTLVLGAATVDLAREAHGVNRRRPAARSVRVTSALLIALAGAVSAPLAAQASGVVAVSDVAPAATTAGATTTASPSAAGEQSPPRDQPPPTPGWTPTRPVATPARPAGSPTLVTTQTRHRSDDPTHVVVRRGDTLWGIAARHLGPQATDADVAQAWPRWYAANRHLIGSDPGLLLPGQELVPPTEVDR